MHCARLCLKKIDGLMRRRAIETMQESHIFASWLSGVAGELPLLVAPNVLPKRCKHQQPRTT